MDPGCLPDLRADGARSGLREPMSVASLPYAHDRTRTMALGATNSWFAMQLRALSLQLSACRWPQDAHLAALEVRNYT